MSAERACLAARAAVGSQGQASGPLNVGSSKNCFREPPAPCSSLGGPRRGSAASKHRASPAAPRRRLGLEEVVEASFKVLASGIVVLSSRPGGPAESHRAAKPASLWHVSTPGGVSVFRNYLALLGGRAPRLAGRADRARLRSKLGPAGPWARRLGNFVYVFFRCSAWACAALRFGFPVSLGSPPGGHLRVLPPGPAGVAGLGTITGRVFGASFGHGFWTVAQFSFQGH